MKREKYRLVQGLLLGAAIVTVVALTGCESAADQARHERWRETGEELALSYMEKKYGVTDAKITFAGLGKDFNLLGASTNSRVTCEMTEGSKTFQVVVNALDPEFGHDNYQAEEVHAALEEVVAANLSREPEEIRITYSCEGGNEDMLIPRYEEPANATTKEKQEALGKVFGDDWNDLRVTVLFSHGDDSYIEEETDRLATEVFHTPIEVREKVYKDHSSYLAMKDEDKSCYMLAPFMVGETTGVRKSNGDYEDVFSHPELMQADDFLVCVEGADPADLIIRKEPATEEEIHDFTGNGFLQAEGTPFKYYVEGVENCNVYVYVPKDEYPVEKWRTGYARYYYRKDDNERRLSQGMNYHMAEVGDYSVFNVDHVRGEEYYFCFLYDAGKLE